MPPFQSSLFRNHVCCNLWYLFQMSPEWSMRVVAGYHHELTISFWREANEKRSELLFFLPYHQWLLGLVHRDYYHLSWVCLQFCMSWPHPGARALQKNPTSGQGQKSCRDKWRWSGQCLALCLWEGRGELKPFQKVFIFSNFHVIVLKSQRMSWPKEKYSLILAGTRKETHSELSVDLVT